MEDSGNVSYKVYLEGGSESPEVRRFGVERSNAFKFHHLREKLQSVFPSLQNKSFRVYWKDAEGDNVVISSDEELIVALTEMNDYVRKVYVVKNEERNFKSAFEKKGSFANLGDGPVVHEGVICDGCNKSVAGFRYKCIVCPDYDLCTSCEGLGIHNDHFMIRITKPVNWLPTFTCCPASKFAPYGDHYNRHRYSCGGSYSCGPSQDVNARQCPYRGGRSQRGFHGNWLEHLCNQVAEWINLTAEYEVPSKSQEPSGSPEATSCGNNESATTNDSNRQVSENGATPENTRAAGYLEHVGNAVAAVLKPLGIDVEIRTDSDYPRNPENGQNSVEKGAIPREKRSAPKAETQEEMEVIQENPPTPLPGCRSPDLEGWTVLSQNPKIANTLYQMLSMGFTNDEGWLTQLIVAKNGDLQSVLDVLQPVQK